MKKISFLCFLVLAFFVSCGPSQRELAVKQINEARQLALDGDTLKSFALLDSVRMKFPKAEVQIGVAANIKNGLCQQLIDNRQFQLIHNDSVVANLETKFTKEKTEFDTYVQYIHKRQSFNRSWDRSFLMVHLDERGELYLASNYMGKEWLYHTGIRVYDGQLQAKSGKVPLDDPMNHRSDFLDYKWEKVSYMNGKSDSVIQFIAEHPKLNLKCVFLGKRYYYILLEDYDVEAVVDALALSKAIKLKAKLEDEIAAFKKRMK